MQKRKHAVAPLQPGNGSCLPIPERFAIESIRSGPCVLTPPSEIDAASELRLLRCRGFSLALLNSVEHFMSEMLQAFAIFQAAFRYSRGRLSASPESFNPQSPHPPPDSAAEGQRARGLPLPRAFCSRKYLPVRTRYSGPQVSRRRSCTPQVNCGDTGEEEASRLQSRPALRADSL